MVQDRSPALQRRAAGWCRIGVLRSWEAMEERTIPVVPRPLGRRWSPASPPRFGVEETSGDGAKLVEELEDGGDPGQ